MTPENGCGEGAEDVSTAEVYPCWLLGSLLTQGLNVELWELVAFSFPLGGVELTANNIIQFHFYFLLFYL